MNHLFSTQFDIMNAEGGRGQTTRGIWMSKCVSNSNILVLDVEGTDGRERGEDQVQYSSKNRILNENLLYFHSQLPKFLLSTCLKTQLDCTMAPIYHFCELFWKSICNCFKALGKGRNDSSRLGKTCLLFVLRDSTGQTPLPVLAKTLKADLEKIWASLSKVFI